MTDANRDAHSPSLNDAERAYQKRFVHLWVGLVATAAALVVGAIVLMAHFTRLVPPPAAPVARDATTPQTLCYADGRAYSEGYWLEPGDAQGRVTGRYVCRFDPIAQRMRWEPAISDVPPPLPVTGPVPGASAGVAR